MTRIVFYHAPWDRGSAKVMPIFNVVRRELECDDIVFDEVDVETEKGVEMSIKNHVRNVPSILIQRNGRVVKHIKGNPSLPELFKIVRGWI